VHPAAAQRSRLDLGGSIEVGGEEERYLRVLQLAGLTPLAPWSIQPFSPSQVTMLRHTGAHPWHLRYDSVGAAAGNAWNAFLLRPKGRLIANSSFPFQDGGGPTWAGRGFTAEVQAGGAAVWGPLHLELAPLAFAAQNAAFPLAPNTQTGDGRFADARYPLNIDAPQRFGSRTYARVAPGTSSLTLDTHDVLIGISSAPQRWGPAREYPLVLGPNAGGFPSVYLGTSQPVDLWLFRLHARAVYGQLGQSAYTQLVDGERTRLASGLIAVILPRGVPGLELGVSRFIHRAWETPTLSVLGRPFSGIISNNAPGSELNKATENQVASVFARWALPGAKAEFYGEMYREDYPGGFHVAASSLVEKPDDYSAFTIGFQRVLASGGANIRVVRAELVNGETSHQERDQRGFTIPLPPYIHNGVTQGHTFDGLILGSPEAYGGAGWRIGLDDFSAGGRRSVTLERSLRFDWLPGLAVGHPEIHPDVIYDVRAELLRFRGQRDYSLTLIPAIDLNRNLIAGDNQFNLTAAVTVRGWP
jgi:hypothetical protein